MAEGRAAVAAHEWFTQRGHTVWASCPLTETGLVRIVGRARIAARWRVLIGARSRRPCQTVQPIFIGSSGLTSKASRLFHFGNMVNPAGIYQHE